MRECRHFGRQMAKTGPRESHFSYEKGKVVPRRRLELLQPIRPQRPQRCVSTNSTTSALRGRVGRRAWTPGAIIGKRGRGCLSAWRAEPLIAYHIVGTI